MDEMEIHKKLKLLRKERGLTLSNLADKIGSDYQQVSRIERGKAKLTIDVLMKIAKALDTPIYDIVDLKLNQSEKNEGISRGELIQPVRGISHDKHQQRSPSKTSEELLTEILEEIEYLSDQTNVKLQPNVKAALASKIYNQVHQLTEINASESVIASLIKFSLSLISSVLSQPFRHSL